MKYLLSTGKSTEKIEEYIMDIIRLNMSILPRDIPRSSIGFNFIMTDIKESELLDKVKNRLDELITRIKESLKVSIQIVIDSINLVEYGKVNVTITINDYSDNTTINLINENNTGLHK